MCDQAPHNQSFQPTSHSSLRSSRAAAELHRYVQGHQMSTAEIVLLVIGLLGLTFIALLLLLWAFQILAILAVAFMALMLTLPVIIMILVFIIFPPTLLVFVLGWFAVILGLAGQEHNDSNQRRHTHKKKPWFESTEQKILRQRRELGYDTEEKLD